MKKLKVPTFKQKENLTCGPCALSMVLQFYNQEISETEIKNKIGGTKKSFGVKTTSLAEFAKSLNYKVWCFSYNKKLAKGKAEIKVPSKKEIIRFLEKGIPAILAVNSSILKNKEKFTDLGHFIIMTKYSKGYFWYNDPAKGKECKITEDKLMFALSNNVMNSSAYLMAVKPKINKKLS